MKKIIHKLIIISTAIILTFSACSDELDRLWNNPMTYTPAPDEVVSGLFTRLQTTRFWSPGYGDWWWHFNSLNFSFTDVAQINVRTPSQGGGRIDRWASNGYGDINRSFYQSGNADRFSPFYTEMRNYGLIRDELAALPSNSDDYRENVIFYRLATILRNEVALQNIDLYGQIPFFEAFKGTLGVFFPQYDDPMEVYKAIIDEYRAIADELPQVHAAMSSVGQSILSRQDIFFQGDIAKWVQYINAQILKSSVRISGVAEDFAKEHISKAIHDLPQEDFYFANPTRNVVDFGSHNHSGQIQRARFEQFDAQGIPNVIMLRMNHGTEMWEPGIDDPRLPVIAAGFSTDGTADNVRFIGTSMNWERNRIRQATGGPGGATLRNVFPQPPANAQFWSHPGSVTLDQFVNGNPWTSYNPATFLISQAPMPLFTKAEIELLLAEVVLKGFATTGKSAGQHVRDAVIYSTDFWYMINASPSNTAASGWTDLARAILTPSKPSIGIIANYANFIQGQFDAASGVDNSMEIIMQQKYIHLNIMDPFELFAELRRTRRPLLEPVTSTAAGNVLVNQTMVVERHRLPASERTTNAAAYAAVEQMDQLDVPIFWVSQDKRGVIPFMQSTLD